MPAVSMTFPVRTKAKLLDAANEHMFMLKNSPRRFQSFFQDPERSFTVRRQFVANLHQLLRVKSDGL